MTGRHTWQGGCKAGRAGRRLAAAAVLMAALAPMSPAAIVFLQGSMDVSADTAVGPGFSPLVSQPEILEDAAGEWPAGTTLTLLAPAGFQFNTGQPVTAQIVSTDPAFDLGGGPGLPVQATPSATAVVFTVAAAGTAQASSIRFGGMELEAVDCASAAAGDAPDILITASAGTLAGASLVDVAVVPGVLDHYRLGAGQPSQAPNQSILLTLRAEDACDNGIPLLVPPADILLTASGGAGLRAFTNGTLTLTDPDANDNSALIVAAQNMFGASGQGTFSVSSPVAEGPVTLTANDGVRMASVDLRWIVASCMLSPESGASSAGGMHTVTATALRDGSPAEGVSVNFLVFDGPNLGLSGSAVTGVDGGAAFTYPSNGATGIDQIRASGQVDGVDFSCTALQEWLTAACNLSPASATAATGGMHTVRASVLRNGAPAEGASVRFDVVEGPDAGASGMATTDANGEADFTYPNLGAPGRDRIRAGGNLSGVDFECFATVDWVSVGCTIDPPTVLLRAGAMHTVTALVTRDGGPAAGVMVQFNITEGPDAPATMSVTTDEGGRAGFSFTNSGAPGRDVIVAGGMIKGLPFGCEAEAVFAEVACGLSPPDTAGAVGAGHTVTATVLRDGQPVEGVAVDFNVFSGPNIGQSGMATTNAAGQADFSYTSNGTAGEDMIAATGVVAGLDFRCEARRLWVAAGCSLNPPTAANPAGATHGVTVTVTRDGAPAEGVSVAFDILPDGPNSGQTGSGTTDAAGQATFSYTSNGTPGVDTVRAQATVGGLPITCTAGAEWVSPACTLSPPASSGPVGSSHTVTAAVLRRPGIPAAGEMVTFQILAGPNTGPPQTLVTDAEGNASFSYTGSGGAGDDEIRASGTIAGAAFSCTATRTWTMIGCQLTPASAVNAAGTAHATTVEVRQNGAVAPGVMVTFQVDGVNGSVAPQALVTDAAGLATFTYTSNGTPGNDTITASGEVGGAPFTCTAEKLWLIAACDLAPAGGASQILSMHTVTATVLRDGAPAAGVAMNFGISTGPNMGQGGMVTTGPDGVAAFTYTGGTGTGFDIITCQGQISGVQFGCSTMREWIDADCVISPPAASGAINTTHTVTVQVTRNGAAVGTGVPVTFRVLSGPNAGVTPFDTQTDSAGQASFTYTGGPGAGTDEIEAAATVTGVLTACTATRDWIAAACSLSPEGRTLPVGSTHTLTAGVLRNGAPAAGVAVTFAVVGPLSPNFGRTDTVQTDAAGQAAFTYLGSGGIGTDTIRATGTIAGAPFQCETTADWITAGCSLEPAADVNQINTGHTVTTTLRRNGLPLADAVVAFRVIGSGAPNLGTMGNSTTDADGQASFTYIGSGGIGTDTIEASGLIDGVPFSCLAIKEWVDVACALSPANQVNAVGTAHSSTVTLTRNGAPASGIAATFEVLSGPNAGRTATLTTNGGGQATFTYTSNGVPGVDTVRAGGQIGGVPFACTAMKEWIRAECMISPAAQFGEANSARSVTLTVLRNSTPLAGVVVDFAIVSGPNAGRTSTSTTNAAGQAGFGYIAGTGLGVDSIRATGAVNGVPFMCDSTAETLSASCSLAPAASDALAGGTFSLVATLDRSGAPAAGISVRFSVLTGPNAGAAGVVLTGADGLAAFSYAGTGGAGTDEIEAAATIDGVELRCTATRRWIAEDEDGVAAAIEDAGPNDGDGNGDGVRDSEQPNVTTFRDITGAFVTIESPAQARLAGVAGLPIAVPEATPPGATFPSGLLTFELRGLAPGAEARVRIILHGLTSVNTYYKFGRTPIIPVEHYYRFLFDGITGAEITGNQITLHLVDGLRGDDDLAANGVIVEPGAPAIETGGPAPLPPAASGCGACGAGAAPLLGVVFVPAWLSRGRRGRR